MSVSIAPRALRRGGCRAVLPWKALAARGGVRLRSSVIYGSDSNAYA